MNMGGVFWGVIDMKGVNMKVSTNISDLFFNFELPNYRQFCMDNQGHAEGVEDALSKDAKFFLECAGQICPHTTEEIVEDFMSRV